MNAWKRIKATAARNFLARVLENVVMPGCDPIPHSGSKLLDKRGLIWEVKGNGIRRDGNVGARHWRWESQQAQRVGPLLQLDAA